MHWVQCIYCSGVCSHIQLPSNTLWFSQVSSMVISTLRFAMTVRNECLGLCLDRDKCSSSLSLIMRAWCPCGPCTNVLLLICWYVLPVALGKHFRAAQYRQLWAPEEVWRVVCSRSWHSFPKKIKMPLLTGRSQGARLCFMCFQGPFPPVTSSSKSAPQLSTLAKLSKQPKSKQ